MSNINAETYARWWKKLKGTNLIKKNPDLLKGGGSRIHPNTGRKKIKEHEEKADKEKKDKLRIASSYDTEGARAAQAMARARKKSGKTNTTSKNKIAHAGITLGHDKRGVAEAQEMARARSKSGKTIKDTRAEMRKLRKTNPTKYKRLKKEQRKAANLAAFTADSSTWD